MIDQKDSSTEFKYIIVQYKIVSSSITLIYDLRYGIFQMIRESPPRLLVSSRVYADAQYVSSLSGAVQFGYPTDGRGRAH